MSLDRDTRGRTRGADVCLDRIFDLENLGRNHKKNPLVKKNKRQIQQFLISDNFDSNFFFFCLKFSGLIIIITTFLRKKRTDLEMLACIERGEENVVLRTHSHNLSDVLHLRIYIKAANHGSAA